MTKLLLIGLVLILSVVDKASAVTRTKGKSALPPLPIDRLVPLETQRAGQDLELRKVQALLSGPRSKNVLTFEPRN